MKMKWKGLTIEVSWPVALMIGGAVVYALALAVQLIIQAAQGLF